MFANTPYYAVIFSSILTDNTEAYEAMAHKMETLAKQQKGFLGVESARDRLGITVSYWESLESISNWKKQTDHLIAQKEGIKNWYAHYTVRICKVERTYDFNKV